jgi:integrase
MCSDLRRIWLAAPGNVLRKYDCSVGSRIAGIQGVSLHSYRHAWAQRANACGYQQRFAQEALGHNSRAVHEAYAKGALVILPALEEYEQMRATKVIPLTFAPRISRVANL